VRLQPGALQLDEIAKRTLVARLGRLEQPLLHPLIAGSPAALHHIF
jgi:hypothetical protein